MHNKKVTMQQIGDLLGVTKVSVSKALNGQSGISQELREKILATAVQLGYPKLPVQGAALPCRAAFVVAKKYFIETDSFYTAIYYYLNKHCIAEGVSLALMIISPSDERAGTLPVLLTREHLDAIYVAGELGRNFLKELSGTGIPTLAVDVNMPQIACDSVIVDNFYFGSLVTNYLIQHGHREIGFVGNVEQSENIFDRYLGYRKALTEHGITELPEWILCNNDPSSGVYTLDFVLPDKLPTAFVCHCDMAAHFLLQRLVQRGISVPNDVSLISFDNTELALRTAPPLTSVDIDKRGYAELAFTQMKRRLGEPTLPPQRIYMPCSIVHRKSVKSLV